MKKLTRAELKNVMGGTTEFEQNVDGGIPGCRGILIIPGGVDCTDAFCAQDGPNCKCSADKKKCV